jgi:hypothetical protein
MKSLGARASGERLERMRASPQWVGEGFRNKHPMLPGLRNPSVPPPSIGDFFCVSPESRRVPLSPLPVHWGTFSLAMHAWDEPAETLLALAPARGVPLVMPKLGEAVEPARVGAVQPWWRGLDEARARPAVSVPTPSASAMPKALPWPLD